MFRDIGRFGPRHGPEQLRLAELVPLKPISAQMAHMCPEPTPQPPQTPKIWKIRVGGNIRFLRFSDFRQVPDPEKSDWCYGRYRVPKGWDGSQQLRLAELVPLLPISASGEPWESDFEEKRPRTLPKPRNQTTTPWIKRFGFQGSSRTPVGQQSHEWARTNGQVHMFLSDPLPAA